MKTLTSRLLSALCLVLVIALGLAQPLSSISEWKHLVEDSRVMLGENTSWLVQEPRLVSPGYVESMSFVPESNEAAIITRNPVIVSSQDLLRESGPILPKSRKLHVVDLRTGQSRHVFTFSTEHVLDRQSWQGSTGVLEASSYRNPSESFYVYSKTGASWKFESRVGQWASNIESEVPGVLAFSLNTNGSFFDPVERIILVDFNSGTAKESAIDLPTKAQNPQKITKDYVLISSLEKGSYTLNLVTGVGKEIAERYPDRRIEVGKIPVNPESFNWLGFEDPPNGSSGIWVGLDEGEIPRIQLSKDADLAEMGHEGTKVLARIHGAAFVFEFTKISQAAAARYLAGNAKTHAMRMAKEAGVAVAMYSSDYDDRIPPSGSNAIALLSPYVSNQKSLEIIVWTNFLGQSTTSIETPSETEMGYIRGPGGRAVVYFDTSVRWKPD